jgi:hypothetical protein
VPQPASGRDLPHWALPALAELELRLSVLITNGGVDALKPMLMGGRVSEIVGVDVDDYLRSQTHFRSLRATTTAI